MLPMLPLRMEVARAQVDGARVPEAPNREGDAAACCVRAGHTALRGCAGEALR